MGAPRAIRTGLGGIGHGSSGVGGGLRGRCDGCAAETVIIADPQPFAYCDRAYRLAGVAAAARLF